MGLLDRLERTVATLQSQWEFAHKKFDRLIMDSLRETGPDEKMRLKHLAAEARADMDQIEDELRPVEQELATAREAEAAAQKAVAAPPRPPPGTGTTGDPPLEACAWGVLRINAPAVWGVY